MKKTEPIQLSIILIAVLLAYNALQTVPYLLWLLYHWIGDGLTLAGPFQTIALNFVYFAFYTISAIVLLRNSKTISQKITNTASFSSDISISLKRDEIIYLSLVITGCYILATRLPKLLVKVYTYIKESNTPFPNEGPNYILPGENIPEFLITTIIATAMVVYAKTLTEYITNHFKDEIEIDTAAGSSLEEN